MDSRKQLNTLKLVSFAKFLPDSDLMHLLMEARLVSLKPNEILVRRRCHAGDDVHHPRRQERVIQPIQSGSKRLLPSQYHRHVGYAELGGHEKKFKKEISRVLVGRKPAKIGPDDVGKLSPSHFLSKNPVPNKVINGEGLPGLFPCLILAN